MNSTSTALPTRMFAGPVGWLGRSVLATMGYVGGVTLLAMAALGSTLWPGMGRRRTAAPGFFKTLTHQLFWMLAMGFPLVGMVHIAIGSFLSLQAYYGSTFVDGTGAVVGVGLLRNMGGLMSGITFAGILAARMIPELRILSRHMVAPATSAADRDPAPVGVVATTLEMIAPSHRCRSHQAVSRHRGSRRPRSPVSFSRNGESPSARWSAGKRLSH